MKSIAAIISKLFWSGFLLLTSLYCLLTFLPYTYAALIKAPAYEWMPWFVHHHAFLYWIGCIGIMLCIALENKGRYHLALFSLLTAAGIALLVHPVLAGLRSGWMALLWSLVALFLLLLTALPELQKQFSREDSAKSDKPLLGYANAVLTAVLVALIYSASAQQRLWSDASTLHTAAGNLRLTLWSLATHLLVALIFVSVLNLIFLIAVRFSRPRRMRLSLIVLLTIASLWTAIALFLANALSFEGSAAQLYAGTLACAITLSVFSLFLPFTQNQKGKTHSRSVQAVFGLAALSLIAIAVGLPSWTNGSDWNGVIANTYTLLFWVTLTALMYRIRPDRANYNVATILAVVIIAISTYKGLQLTGIFWSQPLGQTDDDIARSLETYASQDASFLLTRHLVTNPRQEPCADLCRILREYTDIRDASAPFEVQLVKKLEPTKTDKPNIFIFVIDSLRPDYLGAYNSKVDFSPNLDAFAHDSIVLRNAFTQYAGTTLSEPAIWSGTMLLHSHYMQPFPRVNALEKLARTDNYQMVISYDTVLRELLAPADNMVKLDIDKNLWGKFEVCSTIEQAEQALDSRSDKSQPVLFYAQPMNVHQFARNNLPGPQQTGWRNRSGFNNRIAYEVHQVDECMGRFFSYLKARGMYDSSIIVLTSDHGDATGEFGRNSHSISIYPEIMRVPLVVHLPEKMRARVKHDDSRVSLLTDITPSLYYLLGHKPVEVNPMFGIPIFVNHDDQWAERSKDILLASDVRAAYGILAENGRYLYVTYDSPAKSNLWDLKNDPNALNDILTPSLKKRYDERIIEHLHALADFYDYKPGMGSLLAAKRQ